MIEHIDIFNPTEDHMNLRSIVKKFSKDILFPDAIERDKNETFNKEIFKKIGKLGILGITVPEVYGGIGMDCVSTIIAHEEMAYFDPSIALSYLAHSILCVNNIIFNCNEEQKKKYLPKLCSGEHIGAMAISETEAGSDVFSMKTYIKEEETKFNINGTKMWITNGIIDQKNTCDILYLYAKNENKVSTFIIEGGTPGFSVGQKIKNKLGMRGSPTAEIILDNCKIPKINQVSHKSSIKDMMRNLQIERLTLAAISIGIAKHVLDIMIRYSDERRTFNKEINKFGQIQRYISNSYANYMACKTYLYNIAYKINLNDYNLRIDCDSIKLIAAKMAKNVSDLAIQTLGGNGYIGEYHVERFWRDAKLIEIGGGTNEILEKNICKDLIKKYKNL